MSGIALTLPARVADTATWSPESFPVYSVGPATTRALSAVRTPNPLSVFGAHTGNGEALAQFILEHYPAWYAERRLLEAGRPLPPLLFLVGETRRDVIPKTLQDPKLPEDWRIGVSEVVVYGTREMPGFADELRSVLERTAGGTGVRARWAVVFSPTGCDGLLRELGLLDETTGKVVTAEDGAVVPTYIATIGPTTRDHLRNKFGFEAHVCASAPTPEALCKGIMEFMR